MARKIFLPAFIILTCFFAATQVFGSVKTIKSVAHASNKERLVKLPESAQRQLTEPQPEQIPGQKAKGEIEKNEKPNSEELAHIHHFHKERVRKIKRHHKKFWAMSKLVLVLCHLALLVIAFLHILH